MWKTANCCRLYLTEEQLATLSVWSANSDSTLVTWGLLNPCFNADRQMAKTYPAQDTLLLQSAFL